jgi:hypothetical protein
MPISIFNYETLISTNTDMIDLDLMDLEVREGDYDNIVLQADFVGFNMGIEENYLDADNDADTKID